MINKIEIFCINCGNPVITSLSEVDRPSVIICNNCNTRIASSDGSKLTISPYDILTFKSLDDARQFYNQSTSSDKPSKNEILSKYEEVASRIAKLVNSRQETYGDSFGNAGDILRILYPTGISLDRYDDLMAITRILDKMFRIATGHLEDSYTDIVGYGLLGACRAENKKKIGDN